VAWLRALVEIILPPVCRVCARPGEFPICRPCLDAFRLISPPWCVTCGRPLRPPVGSTTLCEACRTHAPLFSRARPAGIYEGVLRETIHALKFGGCRAVAGPLGDLIGATVQSDLRLRADVVVPVPLHPIRHRQRGFNQSELLARRTARVLALPCEAGVLRRARITDAQSGLTRDAREANVRGAFVCAAAIGGRVLLVDDVMSTGFTASECARALRGAGAAEVIVATAAAAVLE